MAPLSDCYDFAFKRLKANFGFYIVAGLAIWVIPLVLSLVAQAAVGVVVGVVGAYGKWSPDSINLVSSFGSLPFSFVIGLLPMPFYASFFRAMASEAAGSAAPAGSIFDVGVHIVPAVIAGVLAGLILLAGYLLCVVPGLLLTPIFYMALYYVAQGETATASISKSFSLLTSRPVTIAYWWGIFLPLGFLGALLCCVGYVATLPMSLAAFYFMMRSTENPATPPPLPPA